MYQRESIFVPKDFLEWAKNDPLQWSIASFAIMTKGMHESSVYFFENEAKFRKDFGVNHHKAKELISALEKGIRIPSGRMLAKFYEANGRKYIRISSLKRLYRVKQYNRKNEAIYGAFRIEVKRESIEGKSLKAVEVVLRELLIENVINSYDNAVRNKSTNVEQENTRRGSKENSCLMCKPALSQEVLAKKVGISERTLIRYMNRLKNDGRVKVISHKLVLQARNVDKMAVSALIIIGVNGFTRDCNEYSLSDSEKGLFRYCLYNARGRNGKSEEKVVEEFEQGKVDAYIHELALNPNWSAQRRLNQLTGAYGH